MSPSRSCVAAFAVSFLVACSIASIGGSGALPEDVPLVPKVTTACVVDAGPPLPDMAVLSPCACAAGGAARCVARDTGAVPEALTKKLSECDLGRGLCLPEDFVRQGGQPPACKSSLGAGRCLSLCVPEVAAQAKVLDRGSGDVCAPDARCVPCVNPLDGVSTRVCELPLPGTKVTTCDEPAADAGAPEAAAPLPCPYEGPPLLDVTKFPKCGDPDAGGGARCVPANVFSTDAGALAKCEEGICAPEKSIAAGGQYLPKSCRSFVGEEGRCVNVHVPGVSSLFPRDACDADERCVPCFSPADGKPTGVCTSVSCDAPKEKPAALPECCSKAGAMRGRCVPESSLPESLHDRLSDHECRGRSLCLPRDMLSAPFSPPKCAASSGPLGNYTGVCLSDCLSYGIAGAAFNVGNCGPATRCVPCMRDGKPTGAPGCAQ